MALTSTGIAAVQLEAVQSTLPILVEDESTLDSLIQDNGRAKKVSSRSYRIPMKTARPAAVSKINLDSGNFPRGGNASYDVGTLTPLALTVPLEMTKLVELTGAGGDVSTLDVVNDNIADAAESLKRFRDIFLQTDGTGALATVDASYGGGGANPIVLSSTPFGARLLEIGQKVQVFTSVNALRGTCTITKIQKALGQTQTITVDAVPAGTVATDKIMVDGVEVTSPVFINGLPVFNSTSGTGFMLGIDRSNSYVQANGVNAAGAQISGPTLRLLLNQVRQALGDKALKGQFFHAHPSQVAAYEELGFELQTVPMEGGKANDFDLLFRGKKSVAGIPIYENIHADQTRWDLIQKSTWGKVKWGNPPFFYEVDGQKLFPIYGSNGSITAGWLTFLVDCYQTYVDNAKANGAITACRVPTGN